MKRTMTITCTDGDTIEVSGMELVPGLLVHEDPDFPGLWCVTHIRSGGCVTETDAGPEQAALLAARLAPVIDWTLSAAEIRSTLGNYREDAIGDLVPAPDCYSAISGEALAR